MSFQELCLLCYGTQRLRHNQVGRVAQSPLWPGVQLVPISPNSPLSDHLWPGSLVFFVQELVLDGMGLAETARSTLVPTMVVTELKK